MLSVSPGAIKKMECSLWIDFYSNAQFTNQHFKIFMKNLSVLSFALVVCGVFVFSSCKKDDSPQDLLSGPGCWKTVKSETRSSSTDAWTDSSEACSTDDCSSFTSDGKYSFDEGATKCDASDDQTSSGTYVLSEDGKTMTLTQDGLSFTFSVEELTAKKMVLVVSFLGETRTTFEAQ
jgi:Lipocalin-like domain